MSDAYLLLCGGLWRSLGDRQSGWELIAGLRSGDPEIRGAARAYLLEAGLPSFHLLQAAVASGALTGMEAAECMTVLLLTVRPEVAADDVAELIETGHDC